MAETSQLRGQTDDCVRGIDETLGPDEIEILFIGAFHKIKNKIPKGLSVREIKDANKVRLYQKLPHDC